MQDIILPRVVISGVEGKRQDAGNTQGNDPFQWKGATWLPQGCAGRFEYVLKKGHFNVYRIESQVLVIEKDAHTYARNA
jgi:hypothetical protein